jgi:hypothetical protein
MGNNQMKGRFPSESFCEFVTTIKRIGHYDVSVFVMAVLKLSVYQSNEVSWQHGGGDKNRFQTRRTRMR